MGTVSVGVGSEVEGGVQRVAGGTPRSGVGINFISLVTISIPRGGTKTSSVVTSGRNF